MKSDSVLLGTLNVSAGVSMESLRDKRSVLKGAFCMLGKHAEREVETKRVDQHNIIS